MTYSPGSTVQTLLFAIASLPLASLAPEAAASPGITARVSVKRVLGPGGTSNAFWSLGQIQAWMSDASGLFEQRTGLRLQVVEVVDLPDPQSSGSWFDTSTLKITEMEAKAVSNPQGHAWRSDAINLYLVNSIANAGGVCSFPIDALHTEIIVMQPSILNDGIGLAHEFGHYFGLRHTHANHEGAAGGCAGGPAGDCVDDTNPDADPGLCGSSGFLTCHNQNLAALGYPQEEHDDLRYNVMSYHGPTSPTQARLTWLQAARVNRTAIEYRSHVLDQAWSDVPFGWQWLGSQFWSAPIPSDYSGDGKADRAIYDPGTGATFVIASETGLPLSSVPWGASIPGIDASFQLGLGDFDGDGKTDRAFVHSTSGHWFILLTAAGGVGTGTPCSPWGSLWAGIPPFRLVLGDFDGDHLTDKGVYKTDSFSWFLHLSGACAPDPSVPWGGSIPGSASHHIPIVADFDGDGRDDHGIVDPTTGAWFVVPASASGQGTGTVEIPWSSVHAGQGPNHELVIGDYDGDGKAERATRDTLTGKWYVAGADQAPKHVPWGAPILPAGPWVVGVPADYDGDGMTDPAVVDRSTGKWYVWSSKNFASSSADAPASSGPLGTGCGQGGPVPHLDAGVPTVGGVVSLHHSQAPAQGVGLLFVSGVTSQGLTLPGCLQPLAVDLSVAVALLVVPVDASGKATSAFLVPNSPGLVGLQAALQTLFPLPTGKAMASDGLLLNIGN